MTLMGVLDLLTWKVLSLQHLWSSLHGETCCIEGLPTLLTVELIDTVADKTRFTRRSESGHFHVLGFAST
jgi:hypothetical protein